MFYNENLFLLQTICVVGSAGIACWLGPWSLVAHICLQQILANLFVTKQVTLFGLATVTSDVFAVGSILGLNLLQERYGRAYAQRTIATGFVLMSFYVLMSLFVCWYQPNSFDVTHQAFVAILQHAARITLASISVYALVQYLDTHLYHVLWSWTKGRYTTARTVTSLICSQIIDTVLFVFLGLYGIVGNIWHVMAIGIAIKFAVILISTPCIGLMQYLLGPVNKQQGML